MQDAGGVPRRTFILRELTGTGKDSPESEFCAHHFQAFSIGSIPFANHVRRIRIPPALRYVLNVRNEISTCN